MTRDDLRRLRTALSMILLAWIVLAAAAASPAMIASSALSTYGPDRGGALLIESLIESGKVVRASWVAFASPLLLLLLAAPLLSVAWLRALGRREPLRESLAHGARRYGSAVLSSLVLVPVLAVALVLAGAIPAGVGALLDGADVRTSDLCALLATLPGLAALALWAAWHDLARARLATTSESWLGATMGAFRWVRPRAVLRYALFFVVGLGLAVGGVVVTGMVPSALAVVLGQVFVLARLAVRGLYLAGLVRA
jgi:hypothetical protein